MNTKGQIPILLILLLAVAFIVGLFTATTGLVPGTGGVTPTNEHQAVASSIIVKDISVNMLLVPICVDTSETVWGKPPALDLFENNRVYSHSTWLWQRYGDTEACMTIWGPGEDGATYLVEVARLGGHHFEVKAAGQVKATWQTSPYEPNAAYIGFEVTLASSDNTQNPGSSAGSSDNTYSPGTSGNTP